MAADLGFADRETTLYRAPLPDYSVPHLPDSLSGVAAGLLGTALVGAVAWGAGRLVAARPRG